MRPDRRARLLSPLDLAVTKIGRMAGQDRNDIALLAHLGLVTEAALRKRAEEALLNYVGDLGRVQGSIEIACRTVAASQPKRRGGGRT